MATTPESTTVTVLGIELEATFVSGQEIHFSGQTTRNGVDYTIDVTLVTRDLALERELADAAGSVNPMLDRDYYERNAVRGGQTEAWVVPGDEFFRRWNIRRLGTYADATDATYKWFRETFVPAVARWAGDGHEELPRAERRYQEAIRARAEQTAEDLEALARRVRANAAGHVDEVTRRWLYSVHATSEDRLLAKYAEVTA